MLLLATNAAFAALQLILGLLLFFTYSVHFAVLSVLCAGLWASINWFAKEVAEVQRVEEEEKRRGGGEEQEGVGAATGSGLGETRAGVRKRRSKGGLRAARVGDEGSGIEGMDSGDDTETEGTYTPGGGLVASDADISSADASAASAENKSGNALSFGTSALPAQTLKGDTGVGQTAAGSDETSVFNTSAAARLAPAGAMSTRRSLADSTGDLSTDSEWEKVDNDR